MMPLGMILKVKQKCSHLFIHENKEVAIGTHTHKFHLLCAESVEWVSSQENQWKNSMSSFYSPFSSHDSVQH